ncbi:MAG TPA: hypothetical protein PLA94_28140, partial [Myxococcota bacterium]|nr:hypothetical protein [Myxococcota bacterium]
MQSLEQLCMALRAAGLPVGPRELLLLRHVMEQGGGESPGGEDLLQVLRALLVRGPADEAHLRRVWENWTPATPTLRAVRPVLPSAPGAPPEPHARRRLPHWLPAALLLLSLLTGLTHLVPDLSEAPAAPVDAITPPPPPPPSPELPDRPRATRFIDRSLPIRIH